MMHSWTQNLTLKPTWQCRVKNHLKTLQKKIPHKTKHKLEKYWDFHEPHLLKIPTQKNHFFAYEVFKGLEKNNLPFYPWIL
jgi:hypothetical protein